jgi:hypothetical protein
MTTNGSNPPASPRWDAVLLVCRACRKRGSGPKGFGAKAASKAARRALRDASTGRPRVVLSSCLGLCPKGAMAIAFVARDAAARIAPAGSLDDVAPVVRRLAQRSHDGGPVG